MKTLTIGLFVLVLVVTVGCGGRSGEGPESAGPATGPQSAKPASTVETKPVPGEAEHTFSLSVPFESVALTQGEEESVRIGILRGENFSEEVAIDVSGLPAGVTVTDAVITPGSTGVTLTFKAASDAALGDFTAKVTGHTASSGDDFSKEIEVTVAQK